MMHYPVDLQTFVGWCTGYGGASVRCGGTQLLQQCFILRCASLFPGGEQGGTDDTNIHQLPNTAKVIISEANSLLAQGG